MPLETTWKDIGRLSLYGLLCAGAFFGAALFHWFIAPLLPIPGALKYAADILLVILTALVGHWIWRFAFSKAEPNHHRRSKNPAQ
jgi:hypothetical protein